MRTVVLTLATLLVVSTAFSAAESRSIDATYTATLSEIPSGLKSMRVWIPLPTSTPEQQVSDVHFIDSPYQWQTEREQEFGNRYAVTTIENPPGGELSVKVSFHAIRHPVSMSSPPGLFASKAEVRRALQADRLVTLSPRVRALASQLTRGTKGPVAEAHAIYDHLLATMTYDKVKPGWGKGDTERAFDVHAGNCTDFHSLFMSLARARGIPARFVIGFPVPATASGEVTGYHCWAEFYVIGKGWIPVDASDASKSSDPAIRKFLFGNLDANRIQFTRGRDLKLVPATAEPLNFFIYPYGEADGRAVGVPSVMLTYKESGSAVTPATTSSR
jgi:transglutaminase-like putative cysteine protease